MSNPDKIALNHLKDLLSAFTVAYSDGTTGYFSKIDIGFTSKPNDYPYVSLHSITSRAPIRHLGQGGGMRARTFEIDGVIAIEYEHPVAEIGYDRLTQIRWDVHRHLIEQGRQIPGISFTDFDEASVQTFNADDGSFEDWGFFGQILIPITMEIQGSSLA